MRASSGGLSTYREAAPPPAGAAFANMASAAKIAQHRLERSQERSKWYRLSEEER